MRSDPIRSIYLARGLRDFGDGFVVVLLPVYLLAAGFGAFEVGILATLALLGSAIMTLGIGLLGNRIDQRILLLAASALMLITGMAYAWSDTFGVLLLVAFLGTINPSAGSVSIFVPLEHALLSRLVEDRGRTRMFSRYSLVGAVSAASGALVSGSPELLAQTGMNQIAAIKLMFVFYGLLGVSAGLVYFSVPEDATPAGEKPRVALRQSRKIVYRLAALFSIDAFAGGFAVQSLLALWLFDKFGMSLVAAGLFFFWSGLLSAFSFPVAAWLAGRIGLINTMVYTHIPSSLCLIAAALVPNLGLALALLSVRSFLSQMDVPTRSSYVMAVVTPAERPAAASVTSVPRSLAAAVSPAIAGALFTAGLSAWPLVLCGVLKIIYDLLLLRTFSQIKPPEEQTD